MNFLVHNVSSSRNDTRIIQPNQISKYLLRIPLSYSITKSSKQNFNRECGKENSRLFLKCFSEILFSFLATYIIKLHVPWFEQCSTECRKYSEVALRLLYFPLWLVKKSCTILSTNQMQNWHQSRLGCPRRVFPCFGQFSCFHFEFWSALKVFILSSDWPPWDRKSVV